MSMQPICSLGFNCKAKKEKHYKKFYHGDTYTIEATKESVLEGLETYRKKRKIAFVGFLAVVVIVGCIIVLFL